MMHKINWLRGCLMGLMVVVAGALVGCSSGSNDKATVTGSVSYKGQPLGAGSIGFYDNKLQVGSANLKADGTFIATDLPKTKLAVAITSSGISTPTKTAAPKGTPVIEATGGAGANIPAKYRDPATSGLSAEVKENNQNLGEIKLD